MRELLTISLGNYSNYINTHFWNINLEIQKAQETNNEEFEDEIINKNSNNFSNFSNSVLYNDKNQPRSLIFDTGANFQNYQGRNLKMTKKEKEELIDKFKEQK